MVYVNSGGACAYKFNNIQDATISQEALKKNTDFLESTIISWDGSDIDFVYIGKVPEQEQFIVVMMESEGEIFFVEDIDIRLLNLLRRIVVRMPTFRMSHVISMIKDGNDRKIDNEPYENT